MPDGYMDAAAVPVPDAGDDTLREQLTEGIKELLPVDPDDGTVVSEFGDFGPIWDTADEVSRGYADALLPLIRDHAAAAVQAERERAERCEGGRELERTALRNAVGLIQANQAALARVEGVLAEHWDWKAGRSLHKAIRAALDESEIP